MGAITETSSGGFGAKVAYLPAIRRGHSPMKDLRLRPRS